MKSSKAVVWLCFLICLLALIAAAAGLFWQDQGGSFSFKTLRGTSVQIYGRGLYRNDTLFAAAGYKGQDAVTLFLGVPFLALCALFYRRGSLKAGLLLTGILAYFLYIYVSMAVGAAYNGLFLLYVVLFSASLFALLLAFASIDLRTLPSQALARLPRRGPALFMFAGGAVTLVVWLGPLIGSLARGEPPELLDSYTTTVTHALDLAVITPAAILSGALILQRVSLGYKVAFPLLGIIVMLMPVIAAGTVNQLVSGISFSGGEIAGPIAGFAVLGLLAVWVMVAVLRRLEE
jgi:hypothetical protein